MRRSSAKVDEAAGAVLVTGASTGIGRTIVTDLAERGAIVLAGVRETGDAPVVAGRVHELLLDITDPGHVAGLADSVRAAVGDGGLRAVVNNAGVAVGGPLEHVPLGELRHQFEVNLFGQLAVTQAVLPLIRAHGDGRVVFMGSVGSFVAAPLVGPYAASKHALRGMADALRRELRPSGIRVSLLAPGAVATPIWDKATAAADEIEARLPGEARATYGEAIAGLQRYLAQVTSGAAMPPRRVADAARHALYARRPRAVYLIGAESRAGARLAALLPTRLFDLILRRGPTW